MIWYERREKWDGHKDDVRDAAAIDYSRVIHSASFRRLQGKTQILNLGDGDFYRTRLTHSLEVAQVAGGIVEMLRNGSVDGPFASLLPSLTMVQAMGAVHDLGHPPFGHGGEVALNFCMRNDGGFEGNGQTLRILARLEKFSAWAGANLTRRTLLGVLKYPVAYSDVLNRERIPALVDGPSVERILDRKVSKPPKCYLDTERDIVEWILEPLSPADRDAFCSATEVRGKHKVARHKSFDCSIMDLADDISFGVHDLEDAVTLGLLGEEDFRETVNLDRCRPFFDRMKSRYTDEFGGDIEEEFVTRFFGDGAARKRLVGRMVNYLIASCVVVEEEDFSEPLLRFRARLPEEAAAFLNALQSAVMERVILSPSVQQLEFKGQQMVLSVFDALTSDPEALLPLSTRARYQAAEEKHKRRVICDHVAGMTDGFLIRTYQRLFSPGMGSVFDRL